MIAGEVHVGLASANSTYRTIDEGNPIALVNPEDGLSLCVTPSGIPANTASGRRAAVHGVAVERGLLEDRRG